MKEPFEGENLKVLKGILINTKVLFKQCQERYKGNRDGINGCISHIKYCGFR